MEGGILLNGGSASSGSRTTLPDGLLNHTGTIGSKADAQTLMKTMALMHMKQLDQSPINVILNKSDFNSANSYQSSERILISNIDMVVWFLSSDKGLASNYMINGDSYSHTLYLKTWSAANTDYRYECVASYQMRNNQLVCTFKTLRRHWPPNSGTSRETPMHLSDDQYPINYISPDLRVYQYQA